MSFIQSNLKLEPLFKIGIMKDLFLQQRVKEVKLYRIYNYGIFIETFFPKCFFKEIYWFLEGIHGQLLFKL